MGLYKPMIGDPVSPFLHLSIPGFHAAVHQAIEPALRGRAVAVAVDATPQAVVFASSVEARQRRVWAGQRVAQVRRRLRDVAICLPEPDRYRRAHEVLLARAAQWSPQVHGTSGRIDVDLAGTQRLWSRHFGTMDCWHQAQRIAHALQQECARMPLSAAIGGGPNLVLARLLSRIARELQAQCCVEADAQAAWQRVAERPAYWLPGLDYKQSDILRQCGLRTIADVRAQSCDDLSAMLGENGIRLYQHIHGMSDETVPVYVEPEVKVRVSHDGPPAGAALPTIERWLRHLSRELGWILRGRQQACSQLLVQIRWVDGRYTETQKRIALTQNDAELWQQSHPLLQRGFNRRVHCERIALVASGLAPAEDQQVLFTPAQQRRMQAARDQLRQQFGQECVHHGHADYHGMLNAKRRSGEQVSHAE